MNAMMNMKVFLIVVMFALGGCAGEVLRHPSDLLTGNPQESKRYVAQKTIALTLDSGYARTIHVGAEFLEIGTTAQGVVFKPVNIAFTVEGAHMHEAYPVVSNGRIVGFYLPVERAFSPLSQSVEFSIQQRNP